MKLTQLIDKALKQLEDFGFAEGTLKSYRTRAFIPIKKLYLLHGSDVLDREKLVGLFDEFNRLYNTRQISRKSLNWRLRGINILIEIYDTGIFKWKVYSRHHKIQLPDYFEVILQSFLETLTASTKRIKNYESILRRFLSFLDGRQVTNLTSINQIATKDFIITISSDRPKSMDDVITTLRKFFSYLNEKKITDDTFWLLLFAPRAREHKIFPCMDFHETNQLIQQIDRASEVGKRDFAILALVASTGIRAGDVASLELSNINWEKNELHFIQGKTESRLILPLSQNILTSIADYLLNGRPQTLDTHLFIRTCAPYVGLNDGVSISCIFRKYLNSANITHVRDDGKTIHGLRRAMGTQMVTEKIPVTTIAQVLGHNGIKATKRYISLDLNGLRKCILDLDSIGGEIK